MYNINLENNSNHKPVSPIRIKKKQRPKFEKIAKDEDCNQKSLFSRNVSQNSSAKDLSGSNHKDSRNPYSKIYIHTNKKKKAKFQKKRNAYNYQWSKITVESSNILHNRTPKNQFVSNFYSQKDTLKDNDDKYILASSSNKIWTLEPHIYDSTTVETGRLKNSYSKAETNCRSVASLIGNEETKSSVMYKRRNLQNTPNGGKPKSSVNFKKIVSTYSSKEERQSWWNLVPWSNHLKSVPKKFSRYSHANSNKQLAEAYKSVPKDAIFSRRGNLNNKRNSGTKTKNPAPIFKESTKEDQTLCLLLKHMRSETDSRLPSVNSYNDFRTVSNFLSKYDKYGNEVI